ncbi:MAG: SRPBCC family protein [Acidobacteriota bacterium]
MAEETTSFRQVQSIPASPERVYDALLDPEKHSAFTGAEATGEAKVGAEFSAWDGYIDGRILDLERNRRIVQEWSTTEWPAGQPPSRVEILLEPSEEGTRLTLVHSDVPVTQAESYRKGWVDYYWNPLRNYFRGDEP